MEAVEEATASNESDEETTSRDRRARIDPTVVPSRGNSSGCSRGEASAPARRNCRDHIHRRYRWQVALWEAELAEVLLEAYLLKVDSAWAVESAEVEASSEGRSS